jgi:demethoxyubiquinone hydroxylase (CLK1/Coq7/Cat5 family)
MEMLIDSIRSQKQVHMGVFDNQVVELDFFSDFFEVMWSGWMSVLGRWTILMSPLRECTV